MACKGHEYDKNVRRIKFFRDGRWDGGLRYLTSQGYFSKSTTLMQIRIVFRK